MEDDNFDKHTNNNERKKAVKVVSWDRKTRKGIVSFNFEDFLAKCREKLEIDDEEFIRIVLDEDGTEIDADFFTEVVSINTSLMVLKGEEEWAPIAGTSAAVHLEQSDQTEIDRRSVMSLFEKIQQNKKKVQQSAASKKKIKTTHLYRVHVGWMLYSYQTGRYHQVKTSKTTPINAGAVNVVMSFPSNNTYGNTLKMLQDHFFPNGKNARGKLKEMECHLGNSKGEIIPKSEDFVMCNFVANCTTQTTRLYLLAKPKETSFELLSDDSSDANSDDNLIPTLSTNRQQQSPSTVQRHSFGTQSPPSRQPLQPSSPSSTYSPIQTATELQTNSQLSDMNQVPSTSAMVQHQTPGQSGLPDMLPYINWSHVQTPVQQMDLVFMDTDTPTVQFKAQTEEDATTCKICQDRTKTSYFQPCGHTFCTVCAVQLKNSTGICAICRKPITKLCSLFN